ncbi:hypothetical protein, partial [Streptomyces sp. NPDC004050]
MSPLFDADLAAVPSSSPAGAEAEADAEALAPGVPDGLGLAEAEASVVGVPGVGAAVADRKSVGYGKSVSP